MTSRQNHKHPPNEWAMILAGGDGTRLKPLTRVLAGDERPKQFCAVLGGATLLEETECRVSMGFAKEQIVYVLDRKHESYYAPILAQQQDASLVIQPRNAGTAPAIIYALLRIMAVDPNAIVAVFPSDHFVSNDKKFIAHVRLALNAARQKPERLVLLGIEPEHPEPEYGWIEPDYSSSTGDGIYDVVRFWEKPSRSFATVLQERHCLWNSFVMVGSARVLGEIIESTASDLYRAFARAMPSLGTTAETAAIGNLYESLSEVNFSHHVLSRSAAQLAVLKVTGVGWSDLGEPRRVMAARSVVGAQPRSIACVF